MGEDNGLFMLCLTDMVGIKRIKVILGLDHLKFKKQWKVSQNGQFWPKLGFIKFWLILVIFIHIHFNKAVYFSGQQAMGSEFSQLEKNLCNYSPLSAERRFLLLCEDCHVSRHLNNKILPHFPIVLLIVQYVMRNMKDWLLLKVL